jgi:predicted ATP-dependent protease
MPVSTLKGPALGVVISPESLAFASTAELAHEPLPWIGQARAEEAARFGLSMAQADYNLFVLGDVGSGRSTLLLQLMQSMASSRAVPPDLCYLHNFLNSERPQALLMAPGQGLVLRQLMAQLSKALEKEIPRRLEGADFKVEKQHIENDYKVQEAKAYAALDAFGEARHFALYRENGHLVFTLLGDKGRALTEVEARSLPRERRAKIDLAEEELRAEISRFLDQTRPLERAMNERLIELRRQFVTPLLDLELNAIRTHLAGLSQDAPKLSAYLDQVKADVLDKLGLFTVSESDEALRLEELVAVLSNYGVNVLVDNQALTGAPALVDNNPSFRSLFGSIEYQPEEDVLRTDFSRIRAGSLHKASGGFLMLHLRDLLTDELVWDKLRRFTRTGSLQIEDPSPLMSPLATVSLVPEAVNLGVKIVLIGAIEEYYELQAADPEFARRFRVKVDFAASFLATPATYRASAVFVGHTCQRLGLPQFSNAAVVRLLEESHREVEDQTRQSAVFAHTEALVVESAAVCQNRASTQVEAADIELALQARQRRHNYPDQRLQETVGDGDRLISLTGKKTGQINGLTQVDLGDYRFGFPVRVTARTFAGSEGLLNIEREVEMSGPIHDKGVLILHSYLSALFAHIAPLALNASIVFEQEYSGVEGDSASCAELFVLISSLSGLPLRQGVAVTGAVNQHGEVLPVGGINEKIEGYFRICDNAGLDGHQGVLIPHRNRRNLVLERRVRTAVDAGLFHIYTAEHVSEGIALLTGVHSGMEAGSAGGLYAHDSVLGMAQKTLQIFRRACQLADHPKSGRHR